ncbi:MAG: type I methionyl aminopeptidase [Clostridia bacterium]|nr:type I methionyl aminopeptidase [Clostridia bacterium]
MNLCKCGSGLLYEECHQKAEQWIAEYRKKGLVPELKLIKNPKQIEGIREAGRVNSLVLDAVEKMIGEGITTEEINRVVDSETRKLGGIPAPLGYEGFPKSVCVSINNQVCHGIPDSTKLKSGDIVNVDCTTCYGGYYGDASRMFEIGSISPLASRLVKVTKESVDLAVSKIGPFSRLGDIGYWINRNAVKNGFSVVREVGGHGVGLEMHEDPYVCHVGQLGKGMVLIPGMVFTIEPMINAGGRQVFIDSGNGWTIYTSDGSLSAQVEYMVLVTEMGIEILSR